MFLDHIRPLLCGHPVSLPLTGGIIRCVDCMYKFDVYKYLSSFNSDDPFLCSQLAHEYARETGDVKVPVSFVLSGLPKGIVAKRIVTNLHTLLMAHRLLKAINLPFSSSEEDEEKILVNNSALFNNFTKEYGDLMDRVEKGGGSGDASQEAVTTILSNMKHITTKTNLFDRYFETVVPYVKSCVDSMDIEKEEEQILNGPPAYLFYQECLRSTQIRNIYSPFCIPFDAVHVMVYCYVCANDEEAIANLVFDLAARICMNQFKPTVDTLLFKRITAILKKHVSHDRNTALHYVIRRIQDGESESCLSADFVERYSRLVTLIRQNLPDDTDEFAFQQTFPYSLFGNDGDYFGFVAAYAHLFTNRERKGALSTSRRIHRLIKECVHSVQKFNYTDAWTVDVFKMFLATDADMEHRLSEIVQTLSESIP